MQVIGAQERKLVKKTVILNTHGAVKLYADNALRFFDATNSFRYRVIWLVESR